MIKSKIKSKIHLASNTNTQEMPVDKPAALGNLRSL